MLIFSFYTHVDICKNWNKSACLNFNGRRNARLNDTMIVMIKTAVHDAQLQRKYTISYKFLKHYKCV